MTWADDPIALPEPFEPADDWRGGAGEEPDDVLPPMAYARNDVACDDYEEGVLVGTAGECPYNLCHRCGRPEDSHAYRHQEARP